MNFVLHLPILNGEKVVKVNDVETVLQKEWRKERGILGRIIRGDDKKR